MGAISKATEARWRALVRDQESSGKSVREFARAHGLSPATVYWWRSRLKRRGRSKPSGLELAEVSLLPGRGRDRLEGGHAFELVLPGSRRLRVPSGFDPEALRRLLAVLEERC